MIGVARTRLGRCRAAAWVALIFVAACGGSGSEDPPRSGGIAEEPNATSDDGATCHSPVEGCPCTPEDSIVACKTPPIHFGDYTSCEPGIRRCHSGAWGPCLGKDIGSK